MPRVTTVAFAFFALASLAALAGCETTETSTEPPTPAELAQADAAMGSAPAPSDQNNLMFDCRPAPGAPHDQLRIMAQVPEGGEDEAAGEVPALLLLSGAGEGMPAHCLRESGHYTCKSKDGQVSVLWAAAAPKATETVQVREKWLFGTRSYDATCQFKG